MAYGVIAMARLYLALLALLPVVCGVVLETSASHPPHPNPNGQSEAPHCNTTTHFECNDYFNDCIPLDRECDGQWDCAEGQDEANCFEDIDHDWVPSDAEFDEEGWLICSGQDEFRCKTDGKCIKKELLCNGRKDCSDGSDEGAWCDGCQDAGCSHQCENTPNDEKTCQFDSQCSADSKCFHNCIDSIDRLKCVCVDGYDLQNDGFTCSASAKYRKGRLFFSKDGHSVQVTQLFPGDDAAATVVKDLPTVRLHPTQWITSMAYAYRDTDLLYYVVNSSPRQSEIMSVNASDPIAAPKSLLRGHGIKHIAHDWVANNLYYAADGIGIGVCSASGKYCRHLTTVSRHEEGELAQHYIGLIVHPRRGLLLWSEINVDHPTGIVKAMGLDGSKQRAIGHPPAQRLKAISIDYVRDELYTLEADGLLSAYDLRTSMRHPRDMGGSAAGKAMIHFNGWRHFFDSSKGALMKQLMSNPQEVHVLSSIQGSQTAITIDNELYYDRVENPCHSEECSHLCVLKEGGAEAECLCPDKYHLRDDYSGACSFDENSGDGPVRTSMPRVQESCSTKEICHSGQCNFDWDGVKTIACECRAGHSGLYCEIQHSAEAVTGSGSSTALIALGTLIVLMAIAGAGYLVWKGSHRLKRRPNDIGMGEFSSGHGRQALIGRADSCTYDVRSTYSNGQSPPPSGLPPAPRTTSLGDWRVNVVSLQLKEEIRKAYESECTKSN